MALPILQALQEGGVLLVDELERSLHPSLARAIIHRFNDPAANPKNAQIFSRRTTRTFSERRWANRRSGEIKFG